MARNSWTRQYDEVVTLDDGTRMVVNPYSGHMKTRISTDYDAGSAGNVLARFGVEQPLYTLRGEDPENDKAWDRFNRLQVRLIKEPVRAWLDAHGMSDVKVNWSRKAGCSCGCSPAFIADRELTMSGLGHVRSISVPRA